jgi:hypothetical protein
MPDGVLGVWPMELHTALQYCVTGRSRTRAVFLNRWDIHIPIRRPARLMHGTQPESAGTNGRPRGSGHPPPDTDPTTTLNQPISAGGPAAAQLTHQSPRSRGRLRSCMRSGGASSCSCRGRLRSRRIQLLPACNRTPPLLRSPSPLSLSD